MDEKMMSLKENSLTNKEIMEIWIKDPFIFIYDIWGLIPQKILPEYEEFYFDVLKRAEKNCEVLDELKLSMFEEFERWKHITWQQAIIVQAVKDGINWVKPSYIAIKTGHSIWKSNIMWKIIIWFLFCYPYSKMWLTAPDSQTLYDALFSEVWSSVSNMNEELQSLFKKTEDYLSVVGAEDYRFARCKTWKKENPEALAWLHAQYIALICDEASWIPTEIFQSGQSNLTGDINLFIMIWNPMRNVGYFFDAFGDKAWQNIHFSTWWSPICWDYPQQILDKYWEDSDEYRRRVLAKFPREDIIDDKWYVQLITSDKIKQQANLKLYWKRKTLGVDCAGGWKNLTTWVMRDNIWACIVGREKISDAKSIAIKTITIMQEFGIDPLDVFIDNFGAGANVWMEMALLGYKVSPIYVGETKINWFEIVEEWQKIMNIRALLYWRVKKWLEGGWVLESDVVWNELLSIRYRRTEKDQIQIMSKKDMKKLGYESPDFADGLSLTFYPSVVLEFKEKKKHNVVIQNYSDYL